MGLPQIMGSPPLGVWPVPGLQGACPREGTGAAPRLFVHLQQVPLGRVVQTVRMLSCRLRQKPVSW